MSARVKGLAKLQRKLRALPKALTDAAREELARQADLTVDMMQRLVPVDDGALRASITWRWGNELRIAYSQGVVGAGGGPLSIRISAGNRGVRYAHLVEFGAAPHVAGGLFEGAAHPGAPRQPYFFPSYRARRRPAARAVKAAARRSIAKLIAT